METENRELPKELMDNIKESIVANLPEQTSKVLQERLALVDTLSDDLKKANKTIEKRDKQIKDLKEECDKYRNDNIDIQLQNNDLKTRDIEVAKKEEDVIERERNIKVAMLELELKMSNQSKNDIYNLTNKVFGIPEVTVRNDKYDSYTNQQVSKWNPNSNYHETVFEDVKTGNTETSTTSTVKF